MTEIIADRIASLRSYRIPGLNLGDQLVYPNYSGNSILNLPASICRLLGIPEIGAEPLVDELLTPLGDDVRRIILIVMDGLAFHRLQRWMSDGVSPLWGQLSRDGLLAPLTSITPSTTSSALTSLWTGQSAAVHGIVGYEMWLKEFGLVANTILHAPMSFQNDAGSLARAGFDPLRFLNLPTLGTHLSANGVGVFAFQNYIISGSGLSQMLFKDVKLHSFTNSTDLSINLRQLIESRQNERLFAYVYWSEVDHFSHHYGPDDERTSAEFENFSQAFERLFLKRLSPAARRGTLLILTADHGQILTSQDPYYELRRHPNLTRRLHIQPTGENRLAFFYIRPGQSEAVKEYLERTWPNQFILLDPAYAVETGLFGPGNPHPRLNERLGDLIAVAQNNAYLWWSDKDNHLVGRHGGLSAEEMLVPFLAVRL